MKGDIVYVVYGEDTECRVFNTDQQYAEAPFDAISYLNNCGFQMEDHDAERGFWTFSRAGGSVAHIERRVVE